jgi:hypothetical protein
VINTASVRDGIAKFRGLRPVRIAPDEKNLENIAKNFAESKKCTNFALAIGRLAQLV